MPETIELFTSGSDEYARATKPHNSSGIERPAFVVVAASADDVAAAVLEGVKRGLRVVPQATGHGAGGELADDTILVDTSALDSLVIDAGTGSASAGAGSTWGRINPEAERHGLLGLAGSSPTVSISGFTFGGGLGWLTRPHGTASSALHRVEYVDGAGRIRLAAEDAADPMDRDALWAFRGGGGVGIATRLDFDLVPVPDLHAGYLLWAVDALDAVVTAWAEALPQVGGDVGSSISVLHLPPDPALPEAIRGRTVVHLAVAASTGGAGALPLLDAVRRASEPLIDSWGPSDAARLAGIHLDPPIAVPAIGDARWLTADAPAHAAAILSVAAASDSPLALVEIRHLDNHAPTRPGAATAVAGPFVVHAVGALTGPDRRAAIDAAFARVRSAAEPADAGRSVGSWVEGATSVPDALSEDVRDRVRRIADAVDPGHVIARSRFVSDPDTVS